MSAPSIPAEAKADFARYRANGGTADLTTWWARANGANFVRSTAGGRCE